MLVGNFDVDVAHQQRIGHLLSPLPPEEHAEIKQVPGSLPEVLDALEADHEFLLEGDVFTQDVIDTWIEYKRKNEIDPIRFRPHPHEFEMYFDI